MCINKTVQTHRTSGAGSPLTIQSSCTLLPSGTSLLLSFCVKFGGSHTGSSGGVRAGSSHAGSGSGSGSSVSRLLSLGSSICWLSRIGLSRSSALMEYEVPSSWVLFRHRLRWGLQVRGRMRLELLDLNRDESSSMKSAALLRNSFLDWVSKPYGAFLWGLLKSAALLTLLIALSWMGVGTVCLSEMTSASGVGLWEGRL